MVLGVVILKKGCIPVKRPHEWVRLVCATGVLFFFCLVVVLLLVCLSGSSLLCVCGRAEGCVVGVNAKMYFVYGRCVRGSVCHKSKSLRASVDGAVLEYVLKETKHVIFRSCSSSSIFVKVKIVEVFSVEEQGTETTVLLGI